MEIDLIDLAKESLICGSFSGLVVDLSLYPLDTIKTRLQDKQTLKIRYSSLYSGLSSVLIGSAPSSALFFLTYNSSKHFFSTSTSTSTLNSPFIHLISAILGEFNACSIRVPMEIIKQRSQVKKNLRLRQIIRSTYQSEGFKGFYRGYSATLIREIPFAIIQYPLWEYFKKCLSTIDESSTTSTFKGALSGSLAGGIAASLTTPLDVVKTRIMLANSFDVDARSHPMKILQNLWRNEGLKGFYRGVLPRTLWISIGGFIYFGAFQFASTVFLRNRFSSTKIPEEMENSI